MITRALFPLDPDVAFLNHGSFGACPHTLLAIQHEWQMVLEREPVAFFHALPARLQQARKALADFVDADPTDLVYVTNSTYGANIMAATMARLLKPGDSVLITDHEYGACVRAWKNHLQGTGIHLKVCHIPMPIPAQADLEDIIWKEVDSSTKAIFISHITSPTACLMPVRGLTSRARQAGIMMLVDGAHALGHLPLSIRDLGVDMYTGNCHKWMCAPKGSALLWVRPDLQPHAFPVITSWGADGLSVGDGAFVDEHEYTGTRDPSPFLTTPSTIEWMKEHDWWSTVDRAHAMVCYGMERLMELGLKPMSADWSEQKLLMGTVLLPEEVNGPDLQRRLLSAHNIQVICMQWLDKPLLRFSVHLYTTTEEVHQLLTALKHELML